LPTSWVSIEFGLDIYPRTRVVTADLRTMMRLRKVTRSRASFPNDEALTKLYYLALRNISKKWTMPIQNWKAALNRFTILFNERMPQHETFSRLHNIADFLDTCRPVSAGQGALNAISV
jgi:putative transposase